MDIIYKWPGMVAESVEGRLAAQKVGGLKHSRVKPTGLQN